MDVFSANIVDRFLLPHFSLCPEARFERSLELEPDWERSLPDLSLEWLLPDLERSLLDLDLERSPLSELELLLLLLDEGLLLLDVPASGDGIFHVPRYN